MSLPLCDTCVFSQPVCIAPVAGFMIGQRGCEFTAELTVFTAVPKLPVRLNQEIRAGFYCLSVEATSLVTDQPS